MVVMRIKTVASSRGRWAAFALNGNEEGHGGAVPLPRDYAVRLETNLLIAKSGHGIDVGGAAGGDVAGD